ncbi:hypothetical protein V6R85_24005 [Agrobacterium sp. CCNWLW32]|uniref:hypothetical protein n=1 Tax=Agrobacterium sp. CCNWLW32 TaxID=3122072 RepID=UPI00300FE9D9
MTVIDAKVLERRRRMRDNSRLMDERWAKLQGERDDGSDIEEDSDPAPTESNPHPDGIAEERAGLPKSAILRWFRGMSLSPVDIYSFKISYPVGLSEHAQERIVVALRALDWEERWNAWTYMGDVEEHEAYRHLETMLRMEVRNIFHVGDPPPQLSGSVTLRWNRRHSDSHAINCLVSGLDRLTAEKRQQFQSSVERHDGFLNGSSLTFPQIHSGEIVDTFKMAGFCVYQDFPSDEPHFAKISESAPIWVSGMIGREEWVFQTKGDFWELRIGGADPALWPRWCYGGRHGDTTFSAANMQFWEAEQLIGHAIQQYLGGHPEQPLDGGI